MKIKVQFGLGSITELETYNTRGNITKLIENVKENAIIDFKIPKYIIMGVNEYIALHNEFGFDKIDIEYISDLEVVVLDIPDFTPTISCGNGIDSFSKRNIRAR